MTEVEELRKEVAQLRNEREALLLAYLACCDVISALTPADQEDDVVAFLQLQLKNYSNPRKIHEALVLIENVLDEKPL